MNSVDGEGKTPLHFASSSDSDGKYVYLCLHVEHVYMLSCLYVESFTCLHVESFTYLHVESFACLHIRHVQMFTC